MVNPIVHLLSEEEEMRFQTVIRAFLVSCTVLVTLLAGCTEPAPDTPSATDTATTDPTAETMEGAGQDVTGGTLRVASYVDITSLDPHATATWPSYMVQELMYDNLVEWDADGQPIPGLAESWDVADDGLTYTFKLREDVAFHDGTVCDANAVKASFDRLLNPERASAAYTQMNFIDSVEVVDPHTVVLTTQYVYPLTLQFLGTGLAAVVSQADIDTFGADEIESPIGTGPYKFVEWLRGDHVTVERNPEYWGEASGFDSVIVRAAPEASVRVTAAINGEADLAIQIAPNDLPAVRSDSSLAVLQGGGAKLVYFNLSNINPPTDDVRVRLAMNYAVNRQPILEQLLYDSGNVEIDSPVASKNFGYYSVGAYPYDPDQARALLEEADYDTTQTLQAIYPTGAFYFAKEIAEAVQADLAAVGIQIELTSYPASVQYNSLVKEMDKIHMAFWGFYPSVTDADAALYLPYRTGAFMNYNYSNPRVDELIDAARSTFDEAERIEMYKEVQETIMADAPFLTLYVQAVNSAAVKNLTGVKYYPNERLSVKWAHFSE
jgi:ABC-type transport system substrate-binding protein